MGASGLGIRPAEPSDRTTIRNIHELAFGQSAEADLVDALVRSGHAATSLVALVDGTAVGHVLLSRLVNPASALCLAPLAVLPDHQRRGIGSSLVYAAIADARAQGAAAILVLGDPAYYTLLGFTLEAALSYDCVYAGSHFMALMLQTPPLASGPLVYPAPFAALG
jgi:putative acetyltransferase